MKPKAAVLCGYGINCDYETEHALSSAGFETRRIHIGDIISRRERLANCGLLALPGGFSFGDDLGSGKVLANRIRFRMKEEMEGFIEEGGLVIGICNGFQTLVKTGLLPEADWKQTATLTFNDSGKFEDRWVHLKAPESKCVFTRGMERLCLPVRHGEGKFVADEKTLREMERKGQIALQYVDERGRIAGYPWNPNGSIMNIAGVCDPSGRIFGMMPHPEAFNDRTNHPRWESGELGLRMFRNAFLTVFVSNP